MSAALDRATSLLGDRNVAAFLHVIGAGETSEELTDADYRRCNVGPPITEWAHPWYGKTTTEVGHSTACGAFQFLGTTWKEASDALGLGKQFTPESQRLAAVWAIDAKRNAIAEVSTGDLHASIGKLRAEWVSLPTLDMDHVRHVFAKFGGVENVADQGIPFVGGADNTNAVVTQQEKPVPALALLQLFGPLLAGLIPQIAKLVKPESEVAQRNVGIAQVVLDTINKAARTPNLQAAVEKMQSDPDTQKAVQQAIVTQPEIMSVLEVGGGIAAAREADLKVMESATPFWKSSAVFWISVLLLPLVYWLVGSIVAGGIAEKLGDKIPPWTQVLLALFGSGWTGEARSGAFNLVIGLILGGICGVYYGVSVTQQKQQNTANTTGTTA